MKKRVLLVGGLGYIGHELQKKFKVEGYEIRIIDNNLFGKWEEEELAAMGGEKLQLRDFSDLVEAELKETFENDRIIVLCYPDYRAELSELEGYFIGIDNTIRQLLEWGKAVDIVVGEKDIARYEALFSDFGTLCNVVGIPQTYGITQSFRSDILVHDIVLQMLSQKSYLMEDDPFSCISFGTLESVVEHIYNGGLCAIEYSRLPLMNLCHIIQSMFGAEYGVHIRDSGREQTFYEDTVLAFDEGDFQNLTYFVTRMQKDWETGMAQELFNSCYFNNSIWNNMAAAYENLGKIRI